MPPVALVEEQEMAFSQLLGQAMDAAVPGMQQSSGNIHALAFKSQAVDKPCLTIDLFADALKGVEVSLRAPCNGPHWAAF